MNKLYLVIGLGITGLSCVKYLKQQGYQVAVNDTRAEPPGLEALRASYPNVETVLGKFSQSLISQADEIVISPGVSLQEPMIAEKIAKGFPVYGDIEIFAKSARAPIVAITGSNGKTTVTTLLGLMAKAAGKKAYVCGNIGNAVLDELTKPIPEFYILELSSFQLEATQSLRAKAAVVLNVSADHMDRYSSFSNYLAAKQIIYRGCEQAIVNANEPGVWQNLNFQSPPVLFDIEKAADNSFCLQTKNGVRYLARGSKLLLPVNKLKLMHQHHLQNALAALALGDTLGLPMEAMLETLREFSGLAHRCQWVREHNQVNWYNDSKATNVGAAIAAIISLGKTKKNRLILIAGGDGKNADFSLLRDPVAQYVDQVILFGRDAPLLETVLAGAAAIERTDNLQQAVYFANKFSIAGDIVLLSPACASFDMFKNYEHRGETFMQAVRSL